MAAEPPRNAVSLLVAERLTFGDDAIGGALDRGPMPVVSVISEWGNGELCAPPVHVLTHRDVHFGRNFGRKMGARPIGARFLWTTPDSLP